MITPINGYTKKDIIWYLKTFNDGTRSYDEDKAQCVYRTGDNHCAVGCFLPHGSSAMKIEGNVFDLLDEMPSVEKYMPLPERDMLTLQHIHDFKYRDHCINVPIKYRKIENVRDRMIQWVEDNVAS